MSYPRMLTVSLMTTLLASPTAYRPNLHPCFHVARLARAHISNTRSHQHRFVRHQLPLRMLLGAEASASIMGIGAVGALRLLSTTIVPKRIRVMTDIDDTVKSSGNKRLLGIPLGGIDAQYPRGVFYPGVFQFSLELSRYRVPPWQEPLSVAVLTARARELLFALEIGDSHRISREFRKCGERNGLRSWGRGPVLYGSVKEWICTSKKSARKAGNFRKLMEDDGRGGSGRPAGAEGGYVFVGDTGEGDTRAGEMMSMADPERMRAIFLHVVSDSAKQDSIPIPADRQVNGVPVVYFRTYVGAAVKAVELGLMDRTGLNNVIGAAKEALAAELPSSSKWKDLKRDVASARGALLPFPFLRVESLTLTHEGSNTPKICKGVTRTQIISSARRRREEVALASRRGSS